MSTSRSRTTASRSGGGTRSTASSSSASSSTHKIPVMITDRKDDRYRGDPYDTPEFVRRDSYYETGSDRDGYKYLQASDVRRQVREAPSQNASVGRYPKTFSNNENLPLSATRPYREFPVTPSSGAAGRNYRGGDPGPVRALYNDGDRTTFDVGYHDPAGAPVGPRNGRREASTPYALGTYREGPTYTDTSKYRSGR